MIIIIKDYQLYLLNKSADSILQKGLWSDPLVKYDYVWFGYNNYY